MKRLLAALMLLVGGLTVEIVQPVHCLLIAQSQPRKPRPQTQTP